MQGMKYESADVTDIGRFIADPAWVLEQKADGVRMIAAVDDAGHTRFLSHTGDPLKSGVAHHGPIGRHLAGCGLRSITLDGELLDTGEFWVFDILVVLGADVRLLPLVERRQMLDTIAPVLIGGRVNVIPQAVTAEAKAALWDRVLAAGAEGVVAKRLTSRYETGRRSRDVLKVKVTRTIDVVVIATGELGHNSATLALHRDGRLVKVGKCSLNGKAPVAVGDVIEVTFLYVVDPADVALCQPRMIRPRPDKPAAECGWDQLDGSYVSRKVVV